MLKETKSFVLQTRATPTERQAIRELARLEQSNVSAVLRQLIRAAAQERGLLPTQNNGGNSNE